MIVVWISYSLSTFYFISPFSSERSDILHRCWHLQGVFTFSAFDVDLVIFFLAI